MTEPEYQSAAETLERIYEEARGSTKLGSPLLMLPTKNVLMATDGKFEGFVFMDLRIVIDLIKAGLPETTP